MSESQLHNMEFWFYFCLDDKVARLQCILSQSLGVVMLLLNKSKRDNLTRLVLIKISFSCTCTLTCRRPVRYTTSSKQKVSAFLQPTRNTNFKIAAKITKAQMFIPEKQYLQGGTGV